MSGRIVAAIVLFAIAATFWFAQIDWVVRPAVKPAAAPATEFSAERAEAVLARILGPERPHPVSSDEVAAVRARILREFAALDIPATIYRGFGCNAVRSFGVLTCASVSDVLAEVKPGAGKAIVLLAHHDSVPAGPGAADDESGVATVIEVARALKAGGLESKHPVLAVLTDGEEAGLLGAAAFLHDPALSARVGVVINVEARGNHGRSLLFQTSPGNGRLIDLYAKSVDDFATSSLFEEIYRLLPNDTDLTLFIAKGFPSFNFAFAENVAHYHTALDTRAHLDPLSLQQHGENMLGLASALEQTDFASLKGDNDIYVDLLGRALPRIPERWALPLAMLSFVLLLVASLLARGEHIAIWRRLGAFAITPALLIGAGLFGWLLHVVASAVSGMPDPSYAYPAALRIALALGVAAAALLVSRIAPPRAAASAVWLWIAGSGIAAAIWAPGLTPYFLFPAMIAGILLMIAEAAPGGWEGVPGGYALLVSALPALLLWVGLAASGESLMGLKLHPLFTLPVALGVSTLVPLFALTALPRGAWAAMTAVVFAAALGTAVFAGTEPSYSEIAPQRLSITYVEDRAQNHALWAIDATAPVPAPMRAIAAFGPEPRYVSPAAWQRSYVAPAGALRFAPPSARLIGNRAVGDGRRVTLSMRGSDSTAQIYLVVPKDAMLRAIDIKDWHFDAPPQWKKLDRVILACMSRDCASITVTLTLGTKKSVTLELGENRFGLPDFGARLLAARPKTAVQSQNGDGILLLDRLEVPGI